MRLYHHIIRQRGIDRRPFDGKDDFIAKIHSCLEQARNLYPSFNVKDEDIPIVFFKTGRAAGQFRGTSLMVGMALNLEFNTHAIEQDYDDMINSTIPHEVAHLVAYVLNDFKVSGHSPLWKSIDKQLGGSGDTYHNYDMTAVQRKRRSVRVKRNALYKASCGNNAVLSMTRHNKIMRTGKEYTLTRTGGTIAKDGFIKLIENRG